MARPFWLFASLFVLLFSSLSTVSAQDSAAPPSPPPTATPAKTTPAALPGGTDHEIMLDVEVRDKSGAPVTGLQQQDFTLLDDNVPLGIQSFHSFNHEPSNGGTSAPADPPVEIILIVDAVNASTQAVTFERGEIKKFLLQNGGQLPVPVSLVLFTDTGARVQQGSSRDGNALAALYAQYETGLRSINRSAGFYGASERFDLSIKTLGKLATYEETRPGRKLAIWFSPGWPLLSGPNVSITEKVQQQLFNSIVGLSALLREARVTLYSVDPLGLADAGGVRTSYYQEFLKGIGRPSKALPGDLGLQVVAVQSGGRVFNSNNQLTPAIAECVTDSQAFYTISFIPPRVDHANEYHSLAVTVDKPGLSVRTRTGYYAQP
jgi:VWFA-related protein